MKKLSFFLMAMLFSVMSFAQTVLFTQTYPGSPSTYTSAYTKSFNLTTNDYTLTYTNINNGQKNDGWTAIRSGSKNGASVATILSEQIAKPIAKVAVNFTQVTASSTNALYLEVAATADFASATKIEADIAKGTVEFTITAPVANQYYRVTIDQAKGSANGFNRWDKVIFYEGEAASGDVEVVAAPEFSVANANFSAAFTLNITSEEGTTLKYTLDNTDPATSATAVEVAANTASVEITKSTAVKAIAIKGDLVSVVKSKVYCYVNTKETAYTVAEAMKVIDAGLGLDNELYIKGTVSKVESYNATYGSITYWIEDEEGNDFECYSGLGLDKAKFTAKEDIEIGAYVVACGVMKKYNTTYEFDYNNYLVEYNAPVIEEPTIECKDALDFGAVAYNAEVAAQTLEVAGYNLTSDITVTLSEGAAFTVDQTTLSAEGGNLVVTPVSPLTVGTHTATLTLASGEATAEVTLTIVAKDVYTITWSVNGETTTTSVVEGDKLVLPAAPEAPEACSEKVFVGWTAAEKVNADGSDIEWVTAATAPTAAATYYAVFAVQEGEGGLSEVVDVLDRALTGVEGTNYASWAGVSATSDAVYAGQSAGGNEAIQLRSNNSNSGVISTTSGGKLAKVVVTWKGETAAGRTLNVYGSNTAYASPTDLYGDASGEKLGTIVCGTSTELVIEGDYAYVGLRSNSGAMYLDEIQITWTTGAAATYTDYSTTCEPEPEGIEVVLENAYKEVYLMWNRANFFGEHATYGEISVQINNYNGYGTYAEGVSSRIDGVKVNGSATFENKGETDLLTATLTDAEGTVYIVKAEVPTPKTYEVVATNATYVNVDQGWTAELTVNGLTVGEEELTLKVYWDGVGGSEEGYEASAGFEGSLQGMILVDKGEGDVLSFEGTLKDASDNSYIFDFEATPKAAETYTLTFEEMVIEPGQWDDNLHITAENTEYAIEFQLFGGKTKGYGEYGFTDDYPDVDEIYINSEYATMAEGTVANYYLNEETSLATIELTVVLGIDIYNITLTGQPLVNPEDILPTDTINITMTNATIGLYMGMPKVAASSEEAEAELSIVLVGENPYKATVEDFSASSYLVTTAGSLTFLRGGLEIVEVGDVKIAYIGVLCSDHKWYNITLTTGTKLPTALENLDTTVAPAKAIVNGQLVIIKNGVQYNAQGAVVK